MNAEEKKAEKLYKKGLKLVEIAEKVGRTPRTITAWRKKYGWIRENTYKHNAENGSTGGNRNAKALPQNKNAIKTGENEKIPISTLTEIEKELYSAQFDDPLKSLEHEIKILQIRQKRMLARLDEAIEKLEPDEVKKYYRMKDGEKLLVNEEVTYLNKLNLVLSIEEAITRVSKQYTNALKQYSEMESQTLKKEKLEQEVKRMKLLNGDSEVRQDDGFIAALKELSKNGDIWNDVDD